MNFEPKEDMEVRSEKSRKKKRSMMIKLFYVAIIILLSLILSFQKIKF
jgi:predicted nucleic acid-binding Zn ribbon protein